MLKEYHCARESLHLKEEAGKGKGFRTSSGFVSGHEVSLLQTGFRLIDALEWYDLSRGRPEVIIDTGSCGALDPFLNIGEPVIAAEIRDMNGMAVFPESPGDIDIRRVRVLEVPEGIASESQKNELSEIADICTMESLKVYNFSVQWGIRFFSLRVITDYAGDNSQNEFKQNLRPSCIHLYRYLKDFLLFISH